MFIQIGAGIINVEHITRFVLKNGGDVVICLRERCGGVDIEIPVTNEDAELLRDWIANKLDLYVIKGG